MKIFKTVLTIYAFIQMLLMWAFVIFIPLIIPDITYPNMSPYVRFAIFNPFVSMVSFNIIVYHMYDLGRIHARAEPEYINKIMIRNFEGREQKLIKFVNLAQLLVSKDADTIVQEFITKSLKEEGVEADGNN